MPSYQSMLAPEQNSHPKRLSMPLICWQDRMRRPSHRPKDTDTHARAQHVWMEPCQVRTSERQRSVSISLWECHRRFVWVPAALWKKWSKPEKSSTQSHREYNFETLSWNVAIYSCHTTFNKWNHILCQTSKDIITWKLFLLPWCMVKSSLSQI